MAIAGLLCTSKTGFLHPVTFTPDHSRWSSQLANNKQENSPCPGRRKRTDPSLCDLRKTRFYSSLDGKEARPLGKSLIPQTNNTTLKHSRVRTYGNDALSACLLPSRSKFHIQGQENVKDTKDAFMPEREGDSSPFNTFFLPEQPHLGGRRRRPMNPPVHG